MDFFLFSFSLLWALSHICTLLVFCIRWNTSFPSPHTHSSLQCKSNPLWKTHVACSEVPSLDECLLISLGLWAIWAIRPVLWLCGHVPYFFPTAYLEFKSLRLKGCPPGLAHLWALGHDAERIADTAGQWRAGIWYRGRSSTIRCLNYYYFSCSQCPNGLNVSSFFCVCAVSASVFSFDSWKG